MKANLINFTESEDEVLKKKVYRYIAYSDLKSLVEISATRISRISRWQKHDPFENVLFQFPILNRSEVIHLDQLPRHYFGQCWTLTKESDLMWQMYRHRYANKGGVVKLESTVEGLLKSVSSLNFSYIGKVKYLKKDKLISLSKSIRTNFENILINDMGRGRAIAEMLTVKRFPYHQEKEVRLIVRKEDDKIFADHFDHETIIESFVSRIVFDPVFTDDDFRNKKIEISRINKNLKMIRSELYKLAVIDF